MRGVFASLRIIQHAKPRKVAPNSTDAFLHPAPSGLLIQSMRLHAIRIKPDALRKKPAESKTTGARGINGYNRRFPCLSGVFSLYFLRGGFSARSQIIRDLNADMFRAAFAIHAARCFSSNFRILMHRRHFFVLRLQNNDEHRQQNQHDAG